MDSLSEKEIIEDFILNSQDLEKLDSMLTHFNVFETLNIVNAEIRHSNVLAWLFDPKANHGTGEYFLKRFLKKYVKNNKGGLENKLTILDTELFDYGDVEVRREWENIDLLIKLNEQDKKVVIAIENKIHSTELEGQLDKYKKIVEKKFKDYVQALIYLTREGEKPGDNTWLICDYDFIAECLDDLLENKRDLMNVNIRTFIEQYLFILRRYIVGNSEIEKICKEIYQKHAKALDLIFEYRPDMQKQIFEYLVELLKKFDNIKIDNQVKVYMTFTTKTLDKKVDIKGEGWTKNNKILLYEFSNTEKGLSLKLALGPGKTDDRKKIFSFCKLKPGIFSSLGNEPSAKWTTLYSNSIINFKSNDVKDKSFEELKDVIKTKLTEIIEKDIKVIDDYFEQNWDEFEQNWKK